ncbi:MAG: helix-turn-helix domain-containing protein [Planctomycetota bacterium]|nr:helix-turn-helix domain-containing protein [Planctomycetota bacterium]
MADEDVVAIENLVRERRTRLGWSQDELARRAGLSRAGVSAIETGRLVPSTAAALALASAFKCRVEDVFRLRRSGSSEPTWAWPPTRAKCRYWRAEVDGAVRLYPVEATPLGVVPHDGVLIDGTLVEGAAFDPARTLIAASCDPAVGLLASALAETAGVRLIALQRPSRQALALLGAGLVHVAGVHLAHADEPGGNAAVARELLGQGYRLLRVARWEEGVAAAPRLKLTSIDAAVRSKLRWVGREPGSGARQCLDDLLGEARTPRRTATDHRGVAEAVKSGWGDLGVCLRLVSEEAGLDFLGVREEAYDLCFHAEIEHDPRFEALLDVVRSPGYRRALGELPGYRNADTGEVDSTSSS